MRPKERLSPITKLALGLSALAFAISSCASQAPVIGVEVNPETICGQSLPAETIIKPGSNAVIGDFIAPVLQDGSLDLSGGANKRLIGFDLKTGTLIVNAGDLNGDGISDSAKIGEGVVKIECGGSN